MIVKKPEEMNSKLIFQKHYQSEWCYQGETTSATRWSVVIFTSERAHTLSLSQLTQSQNTIAFLLFGTLWPQTLIWFPPFIASSLLYFLIFVCKICQTYKKVLENSETNTCPPH